MDNEDDEARIRTRAHELWEAPGRPEGRELEHWMEAQAELGRSFKTPPALRPNKGKTLEAGLQNAVDPAGTR